MKGIKEWILDLTNSYFHFHWNKRNLLTSRLWFWPIHCCSETFRSPGSGSGISTAFNLRLSEPETRGHGRKMCARSRLFMSETFRLVRRWFHSVSLSHWLWSGERKVTTKKLDKKFDILLWRTKIIYCQEKWKLSQD